MVVIISSANSPCNFAGERIFSEFTHYCVNIAMSQSMPENGAIKPVNSSSVRDPAVEAAHAPSLQIIEQRKDKRAGVGFFTAALWMLRKQRGKKPPPLEITPIADKPSGNGGADASGSWTKVLGLVRPLCLQQSAVHSPPLSPAKHKTVEITPPQQQPAAEINPPKTPLTQINSPITPATMSQYGSALSLRDLDNCSDDDDDEEFSDEVFDAISYDEMIDSKAEEFIAQFYKQIHLEKGVPASRHDHERGV